MAFSTISHDAPVDANVSGAFSDQPVATYVGVGIAVGTLGGAALVGAAVLPAQTAAGVALGGGIAALGEVKRRTGSYFPFLDKKEEDKAEAPAAA